ncbi:MAG: methyltransferase domain-containing protein [Acidobacteriota bacterium]
MNIEMRRAVCRKLMHRYYSDVPTRAELLERELEGILKLDQVLFDAGCGAEIPLLKRYADQVSLALGADLCAPTLHWPKAFPVVANLEQLPFRSAFVDVTVSHSVFEHLEDPGRVFKELGRISRPGAKLVFTTPNKYYYSCLVALLIPESVKALYFRTVFGEDAFDHFPVRYRANSLRRFRQLARTGGFRLLKVEPIRHYPYYLMFSPLLFRLGIVYDWTITRLRLKWLQSNWLVVMEKE